jgi:pyridoxamine 5'-phosphate oxidase
MLIAHRSFACFPVFNPFPMQKEVADIRRDYQQGSLDLDQVAENPIEQFKAWFQAAVESEVPEPNGMTLATVRAGRPKARIVLLKGIDAKGFVFYTNYNSHKGQELDRHPYAALTFWWAELERQVRIEGQVERVSAAESDAYFQSRPRGSRMGAWASPQSEKIEGRSTIEEYIRRIEAKFGDAAHIPRPPHWGGYRLMPDCLEFWQGRSSRLHDRIVYERQAGGQWELKRLAP